MADAGTVCPFFYFHATHGADVDVAVATAPACASACVRDARSVPAVAVFRLTAAVIFTVARHCVFPATVTAVVTTSTVTLFSRGTGLAPALFTVAGTLR